MHSLPLIKDLIVRTPATHRMREITNDADRARGERAYVVEPCVPASDAVGQPQPPAARQGRMAIDSATQTRELTIDSLVFHKNGVVIELARTELETFWISFVPGIGYAQFTRVPGTSGKHLLQQLLPGYCPAPSPLVSVPDVLWRRQAAIEADQSIASYRRELDLIGRSLPRSDP